MKLTEENRDEELERIGFEKRVDLNPLPAGLADVEYSSNEGFTLQVLDHNPQAIILSYYGGNLTIGSTEQARILNEAFKIIRKDESKDN